MTARQLRTLSALYLFAGALWGVWSYVMYRMERRHQ